MNFIFKKTRLADGGSVFDIQLVANGKTLAAGTPVCIFSCTTEKAARDFLAGLTKLVEKYTLETLGR